MNPKYTNRAPELQIEMSGYDPMMVVAEIIAELAAGMHLLKSDYAQVYHLLISAAISYTGERDSNVSSYLGESGYISRNW